MKRVFAAVVLLVLLLAPTLWAEVPLVINHQGRLLDANDQPVSGTVQLTFNVYTLETGSAVLLYTETQSGITVTDGLFNVMIGDGGALPDSISSHNPLELGISVNADGELLPRLRIGTVPYALRSAGVSGHLETQPGSLKVPNIGSSGQDGVSITGTQEMNQLSVPNIGSSGQDGVSMTAFNVTKRNAITATQQNEVARHSVEISTDSADGTTLEMSSRLNGLPPGVPVIGTLRMTTNSTSSGIAIGDLDGDGLVDITATNDSTRLSLRKDVAAVKTFVEQAIASQQARLTVKNIGSSGQDGVSISSRDSGTTLEMSSRLNGLPPGTPVIGTLRLVTNDSTASVSIGDPDFDLLRMQADSTGGSISISDSVGPLFRVRAGAKGLGPAAGFRIAATRDSGTTIAIGDPDFDLLRIVGGSTSGLLTMTGDPDFDLLRISADEDSGKIGISGQIQGDPDFDVLRIAGDSTGGSIAIGENGVHRIFISGKDGGYVGIGTITPSERLHVAGNICATGTIGACSDGRYKNKVETIGDALSVIEKLRGVDFEWNRSAFPANQFAQGKQVGFVAQEMKAILPELVSEGSDGYLSVDYGRLTPVLVEAIKAQQKVIENQNGELSAVKTRLEELQKLVSKLLKESNSSVVR